MSLDKITQAKKYVPGVGTYSLDKSYDKITLGASRGWK